MGYQDFFKVSNENVKERHALVAGRIAEICQEACVAGRYRDYFRKTAGFLCLVDGILRRQEAGELDNRTLEECERDNQALHEEILPEQYEDSYLNPAAAARALGTPFGPLLSFLSVELRAAIGPAFEGRREGVVLWMELFLEVYGSFAWEEEPEADEVRRILYGFFYDYSELFAEDKVRDMVEPEYDFFTGIVMQSDLDDLRYLYRYGEYVGDCERKTAQFLNGLPEKEIQSMADAVTEGFRVGYQKMGKDLSKKETVCLEYPIGFERVMRAVIRNFAKLNLKATAFRCPSSSFGRGGGSRRGCCSVSPNRQFEFDHKADSAVYLDKAFVERRMEAMRAAFEKYKARAARHAGPAVTETFGEPPFSPKLKAEALQFAAEQDGMAVYQMSRMGQLTNAYIPGDERSFTMIAYPSPAIGGSFEEIFRETARINTLDSLEYEAMQQRLIDVLDTARTVHITGKGANRTDLWVGICPLRDPETETAFENCVADVNIPVGEVFTSPVLSGTHGTLHVSEVFLEGLRYVDLELVFSEGVVVSYGCSNFEDAEEGRRFVRENLLKRHDTLPMGEFAIGTNTAAYRMARAHRIEDRLPILIAEKMGPHFAVGDTCYSYAEDTKVFNPNGKEIVARDNAVSILRKEEKEKAYFHCHTDITVPYEELDEIAAVRADGSVSYVIRDGRFAVPGTEALNAPLEEALKTIER